jgi:hypothetical protein
MARQHGTRPQPGWDQPGQSASPRQPCRGTDDQAGRREAAAQIRRDQPRWVVIWAARKGEYQARPLFRATPRMIAAATPEELITQMRQVRQPARTRRR